MRAAVFHDAQRPITIESLPDPVPADDELLVEIGRCGICGSDVSLTSGSPFDYVPGCFGHEFAGTIVGKGSEVTNWRIGERVACMPKSGCGHCEACLTGRLLFCPNGRECGAGFAEYVCVPTTAAVRLPQTLSLSDGALVEPMACGLRALESAGACRGQRVLVIGAGSMALGVVWWARQLGAASVVVASRSSHRSETCYTFGADAVHSFESDDPGELLHALGGPPQVVAECVGKEGMLGLALDHVAIGGTITSLGMCTRAEPLLPASWTFKEARLVFPLAYSVQQYERTARQLEKANFQPELMVGSILPLEQVGEAIAAIRAGASTLKIHIDPRFPP